MIHEGFFLCQFLASTFRIQTQFRLKICGFMKKLRQTGFLKSP